MENKMSHKWSFMSLPKLKFFSLQPKRNICKSSTLQRNLMLQLWNVTAPETHMKSAGSSQFIKWNTPLSWQQDRHKTNDKGTRWQRVKQKISVGKPASLCFCSQRLCFWFVFCEHLNSTMGECLQVGSNYDMMTLRIKPQMDVVLKSGKGASVNHWPLLLLHFS